MIDPTRLSPALRARIAAAVGEPPGAVAVCSCTEAWAVGPDGRLALVYSAVVRSGGCYRSVVVSRGEGGGPSEGAA